MIKTKPPLIIIIVFLLFSCKTDKKKDSVSIPIEKSIEKIEVKKENPEIEKQLKNRLYSAFVNNKKTVFIYEESDFKSEKLLELTPYSQLSILEFTDKFETLPSDKKYDYYGKWVKVIFKKDDQTYIKGYVFDDFLDYQFNEQNLNSEIEKDTVHVANEREFINALSSNRVIWIDNNKLNLEKFVKENKEELTTIDYDYDDLDPESEIYFTSGYFTSIGLHGYSNMEIRGKNKLVDITVNDTDTHVLDFYNCHNILIDNINFYHDSPGGYFGACEGEVVTYTNCSNFNIQNSHFDGSGTVGSQIDNSSNFNFLNCEFYNNSSYGIFSNESTNIILNRCDFHDNSFEEAFYTYYGNNSNHTISLLHCYIKNNKSNSIFQAYNNSSEDYEGINFSIENSAIENNETTDALFDFQVTSANINISNSYIKNNISIGNSLLIKNGDHNNFTIKNTAITNNSDFYGFVNETENKIKEEQLIKKNIFNTAKDTILNQYNTYKNDDGEAIFLRNFKDLTFNKETRQLSINGHLLYGKHRINFTEADELLFGYPVDLSGKFIATGNIIEGRLNGFWEVKYNKGTYRNEYSFNYLNSVLEGKAQIYAYVYVYVKEKKIYHSSSNSKNSLVIEGDYKNGVKHGVWKHYFKNGNLQRQVNYNQGKTIAPYLYYFSNGTIREKRMDSKNKNGETICYYPNGQIESRITYTNGIANLDKSSFFNSNGTKMKTLVLESEWENGKITIVEDINLQKKTYNNKVLLHISKKTKQLIGYSYTGSDSSEIILRKVIHNTNSSTKNEYDVEIFYNEKSLGLGTKNILRYDKLNNLSYVSFIDENNIKNVINYGGKFNLVTKSNQYKIENGKEIKHGVSKKYTVYGLLEDYKEYVNGELQK